MAKVTIKRRSDKERAAGRAALYAVLNIARDKIRIPLDIAVKSDEWDASAERIIGRGQEVKVYQKSYFKKTQFRILSLNFDNLSCTSQ